MSELPVKTPCVKVCFVDPKAGVCVGCFRTLDELGRWSKLSADERDAVMADLPSRRDAYAATKSAG